MGAGAGSRGQNLTPAVLLFLIENRALVGLLSVRLSQCFSAVCPTGSCSVFWQIKLHRPLFYASEVACGGYSATACMPFSSWAL